MGYQVKAQDMAKVGLVGCSGFGREIMPLLKTGAIARFQSPECFFVDTKMPEIPIIGETVISESSFLQDTSDEKFFNVAIADFKIREKVAELYVKNGCHPISIKAENSVILDRVELGVGSILCSFTHLTSDVKIGDYFHCNIYSYVAHDCVIGDFVTFAPKVCCNGNVHIRDYAYVGTGAVIKQGTPDKPLVIGEGAVIGMGAIVTKDVAPYEVVVGNPAKPLRR